MAVYVEGLAAEVLGSRGGWQDGDRVHVALSLVSRNTGHRDLPAGNSKARLCEAERYRADVELIRQELLEELGLQERPVAVLEGAGESIGSESLAGRVRVGPPKKITRGF